MSGHHHMAASLPRRWIVLPPSVRTSALSHPLLKGLLPSHIGFFPDAKQHHVHRPQGVGQAIFNYCVRGAGWCELGGRRHVVRPGDLMVVPPYAPHAYGSSLPRPWTIYWFHAVGEQVEPLLGELGVGLAEPVVPLGHDPRLVAMFQELQSVLEDDYAFAQLLYASELLGHLIGVMLRLRRTHDSQAPDANQRVLATIQHMKQHLDAPLEVAQLASLARLSVSHYVALFRRLTRSSPKAHFSRLRLYRAARLLLTTSDSVSAIARQTGYQDPLYFSRVFRRVHGVSPSEYRQGREREDR
jgi:AraC-like DNA-binding protein